MYVKFFLAEQEKNALRKHFAAFVRKLLLGSGSYQ
jgi:hypothetical protein